MWCISGGQLDGWRVAGREESCVRVLKIQLYMKSDIWSPEHSWERDIRVSTERCCSLCCLAESEVLPKGSDTRNSSSTNTKKEKNQNKILQDSLLTIKTHAAIVDTLLVLAFSVGMSIWKIILVSFLILKPSSVCHGVYFLCATLSLQEITQTEEAECALTYGVKQPCS